MQAELAHVLPSLSALADGRAVAHQHERYRSHRAVRALLEQLAQTRPLVLVLDDFHWADPASVELLGALLRRPPAAAVLTAHRAPPAPDAGAPRSSARAGASCGGVDAGSSSALSRRRGSRASRRRVDAAGAAALYEESGGNPFYLEQLARSLDRAGDVTAASEISLAGSASRPRSPPH